jgi:hypothetical protein
LEKRLRTVAKKFGGFTPDHMTGLRQRLYESLDDDRSGTAAVERAMLAWVGRARAALDRLAHACRPEIVGRRVRKQSGEFSFCFEFID